MNLVLVLISALIALAGAAGTGVPHGPTVSTSSGVTAAPSPTPTPAPVRNDVVNGGGPA